MKQIWALVLALATPLPALAHIVWNGDFETGDRTQWTASQLVNADRLRVVSDTVAQGRYALRSLVRQGDDPIGASGNRNELVRRTLEAEGSEYFYRWRTRFDASYPKAKAWGVFVQWHQDSCCGSPPISFYTYGDEVRLQVGGDTGSVVWSAPLVTNSWHDFVFHVKWSPDRSVGFVELVYNGKVVLPKTYRATMLPGYRNYLKVGLYREASIAADGIVFHDAMVQGTRREDVSPPPPPAVTPTPSPTVPVPVADAGTPDPEPMPAPEVVVADSGDVTPVVFADEPLQPERSQEGLSTSEAAPLDATGAAIAGGCSSSGGSALSALGLGALALALFRRRAQTAGPKETP